MEYEHREAEFNNIVWVCMLTFLAGVAFLALDLTAMPLDLVAAFFLGAAFLAAAGAAVSSAVLSALGLAAAFFVAVFLAAGFLAVVFLGAYKEYATGSDSCTPASKRSKQNRTDAPGPRPWTDSNRAAEQNLPLSSWGPS